MARVLSLNFQIMLRGMLNPIKSYVHPSRQSDTISPPHLANIHVKFTNKRVIKQFVVTNCSKERPGSIVNKTLKNGILMLKDTSKESDFHADSKYISFIKFSLCYQ